MLNILRVNLQNNTVESQSASEEWKALGGRALISKILLEEVDPTCNPLGPNNKLIVAPGLLGGTTVSCVNRISIGGKSPLTGTIKESNAGGVTAYKLARLGIKAIIFEGIPKKLKTQILYISNQKTELLSADEYKGLGVYETAEKLKGQFNSKIGMIINGFGGERLYKSAGIANADKDGVPSRYSGRGGLGALMGSKGIKAVVIDDANSQGVVIKNDELFKNTRTTITQTILGNEAVANSYTKLGTAGTVKLTYALGALPTRNFSNGNFEGANNINGDKLYELITTRKGVGNTSHACMPGCMIKCSNIFPDEEGRVIVSPLEYETIGLLGSNLGIDNLDMIGRFNYICNDMGLDTIEVGGAIGVAMEAGIVSFGDCEGVLNLFEEIKKDSYIGKIIASGASTVGDVLGVQRVPVVKGQTMAAYDPRAIKGLGVTYATSPQGADHTAGQTLRAPVDHSKPEGQVEASKKAQIMNTIHDSMGTCIFLGSGINGNIQLLADLYEAMSGETCGVEALKQMSIEALLREREFNKGAGFTAAHDRLPEYFYSEVNPASNTVFDVDQDEMLDIFEFEETSKA